MSTRVISAKERSVKTVSAQRIKNWLIYRFIRALNFWAGRLPRKTALPFFGHLGLTVFWVLGKARRRTVGNLSRAFGWSAKDPRLLRTARTVFVNAGKNLADLILLPRLNGSNVEQVIRIRGQHYLDEAAAQGRGVIAITGHIGNWELLAAGWALRGYPVWVVARQVYDPRLDRILNDIRENAGVRGISRDSDIRQMIRVLRRGELLGVLMDQDTRVRGAFVPFFGRPAHTPVGPVLLAMKTKASIVPMAIHRQRDDTHLITVRPNIKMQYTGNKEKDIRQNTWACTRILEQFIRQDPAQWVWMHDRWRKRPGKGAGQLRKEKFSES
jgi:KDO2-lipid IV(A) lauroyltransferase